MVTTSRSTGQGFALTALSRVADTRAAVPLLLGTALLLRLPYLFDSLWLDEVLKGTHHNFSTLRGLWRFVSTDLAAPLYSVVQFFWVALVGEHDLAIRSSSLLLGLGSIWLIHRMARRFDASPALAALMLCLSPVFVWYTREATHYAMYVFLVLVPVYVWPRVVATPVSARAHVIYTVSLLAACWTHYFAAVYLAVFTVLCLRAERSIRNTILLSHAVIAVALVLWLVTQHARGGLVSGQGHLRAFTPFEWWMLFFHWFLHGNTLGTVSPYRATVQHVLANPTLLVLQLAACALVVRGLLRRSQTGSWWPAIELALLLLALPAAMLVLTLAGFERLYIERYLIVGLPFFALAIARGAAGFSKVRLNALVPAAVLALGVVSYAFLLQKDARWTVYKHNPDWRSAARFVEGQAAAGERPVLIGVIPLDDFDFYLRRQMADRRPPIRWYEPKTFDRFVERSDATQIVIVRNLAWPDRVAEVIDRCLKHAHLQRGPVARFKLVELHTFVPVTSGSVSSLRGPVERVLQ